MTTPDLNGNTGVLPRLPGQNMYVLKTPQWSTTTVEGRSGRQARAQNWVYPKWQFKISYEVIRDIPPSLSELQQLWAFFNQAAGSFNNWSFFDPYDNTVTNWQFGTGDGGTTQFQLTRQVGAGTPYTFTDVVNSVVSSPAPQIYKAGTLQTSGYAISSTGLVTFSAPPAAGAALTWSGQFMFWCHFSKDELQTAQEMMNLWSEKGVEFETVKP